MKGAKALSGIDGPSVVRSTQNHTEEVRFAGPKGSRTSRKTERRARFGAKRAGHRRAITLAPGKQRL